MKWLKRAAVAIAALYLVVCAAFFFYAPRLMFPFPPAERISLPAGMVQVDTCGAPGVRCIHAPAAPGKPTAIFFHGNGRQLADRVPFITALHANGLGVLAVEYPGYGGTPGAPSERTIYAAANSAAGYLRSIGVPAEKTVVIGRSLGTGVATEVALATGGARLILISPFTSIPDVGAQLYPWLPVHMLARQKFDSLSRAPELGMPALVIHGTSDEEVPFEMGKTLAARLPHGTLVPVPGAHHNDMLERPEVVHAVARFAEDGVVESLPGTTAAVRE